MVEYNTYLQTVAAISSAVAAIAAVYVAKSTFRFQKNSLLKKFTIEQILRLLKQLQYLKSLTAQDALGVADSVVTSLEQRIAEMKESILILESMISDSANADLKGVRDFVYNLCEASIFANNEGVQNNIIHIELDAAINFLQNIYHKELK